LIVAVFGRSRKLVNANGAMDGGAFALGNNGFYSAIVSRHLRFMNSRQIAQLFSAITVAKNRRAIIAPNSFDPVNVT
jgi:hypothetical protein